MAQTTEELYLIVHPGSARMSFLYVKEAEELEKPFSSVIWEWGGEGES